MDLKFIHTTPSCLLRIKALLPHLNPAEKKVASFIHENPRDVLALTITDLAEQTSTSYATVTRLISHLGFSGYKDFKKLLYQDTLASNSLDFVDVITSNQGTTPTDICHNIYQFSSNILTESHKMLDPTALEVAAQAILEAHAVCFVGTGLSGICARYAYSRFFRIGIQSAYDADMTHSKMLASLLTTKDVLFSISSSGRSGNTLECVELAKQNNAKIISLSDYALSPLSQLSDIQLFTTPRNSNVYMDIDMPLLIGQLYIIDALFMCCCVKMGKDSSEIFAQTKVATHREKYS